MALRPQHPAAPPSAEGPASPPAPQPAAAVSPAPSAPAPPTQATPQQTTCTGTPEASARRRSGAVLSYAYTICNVVVNLLYVPLLLNGIGTSEYGLYQLIGSVMAYMAIMNSTFSAGTTRYYCKYHAEGNTRMMENTLAICARIYRVVSLVAIAVGIVAILVVRAAYARTLTDFQLWEATVMLAVLVANLIVTMNNTINAAVINAHERFAFLKAMQLFALLVQPVAVVLLIRIFPYAVVIPCVQIVFNIVCATAQRLFARRVLGARVVLHEMDRTLLRGLLTFSTAIVMVTVADQIFWRSNQLILGYVFGTEEVAVYGVAYQIFTVYMSLGQAIPAVFMPRITELYAMRRDMRAISELFAKVGRLTLYPLLAVLLGFAAFGADFIALWAGEGFSDAYAIALVLMVALTIDVCQNLGLTIMQVMDRYYFRGKVYLVMAALNIVAVLIVAPRFGGIGAAVCSSVAMLIGNGVVMNVYYARAMGLDIRAFWLQVLRMAAPLLCLGLAATAAVRLTVGGTLGWPGLAAGLVAWVAAYCALAWAASTNEYEKGLVRSLLARFARGRRGM